MTLPEDLAGTGSVFIDTAPIIYYLQAHPEFGSLAREAVVACLSGNIRAYSSVLTITEVLTKPIASNDRALAQKFAEFLKHSKYLTLIDITEGIAQTAGNLRGHYSFLKTIDALQIASALDVGAGAFLTNDAKLRNIKELTIIVLKDYL